MPFMGMPGAFSSHNNNNTMEMVVNMMMWTMFTSVINMLTTNIPTVVQYVVDLTVWLFAWRGHTTIVTIEKSSDSSGSTVFASRHISEVNTDVIEGVTKFMDHLGWEAHSSFQYGRKIVRSRAAETIRRNTIPPNDEWISVMFNSHKISLRFFHRRKDVEGKGGGRSKQESADSANVTAMITDKLFVYGASRQIVEEFLIGAMKHRNEVARTDYDNRLRKVRYNYITIPSRGTVKTDRVYTTPYKLANRKTLDLVYFPQKPQVIRLLDHFMAKTGRYARESAPHKLGMLLYGPPGTGKTSLIKAIANYTKRHIISVRLSAITTNEQLKQLMLKGEVIDTDYNTPRRDILHMDTVIYVMEEIDIHLQMLQERAKQRENKERGTEEQAENSDDESCSADIFQKKGNSTSKQDETDALDLATILEVMDGVVDTPGRILIMTTNHIDAVRKMDKAFLRPGRIDFQMEMTYMTAEDSIAMMEYEYDTILSDEQREKVTRHVQSKQVTAAELEALCRIHETLDEVIATF